MKQRRRIGAPPVKFSEWLARSKQAACALFVNSAHDRRFRSLFVLSTPIARDTRVAFYLYFDTKLLQ